MAKGRQAKLELPRCALLLTLLPLGAIFASGALMQLGFPAGDFGLPRAVGSDPSILVHAEAAGRMKVLATWALLAAMSFGCIAFFAFSLSNFAKPTRRLLIGFYLLCSLFGMTFTLAGAGGSGERVLGESVLCSSLGLLAEAAPTAESGTPRNAYRCPDAGVLRGPPAEMLSREVRILTCPPSRDAPAMCEATVPGYVLLRRLNLVQRLLIPWAATTLILGAISCLAFCPGARNPRLIRREQVHRLNTYLYLTAALFVCGLLFLSALLQWPGYAFEGKVAEAYRAHASGFVLYWGVAYSIIIAAYYLPVAFLLSRGRGKGPPVRSGPAQSASTELDALGPFELLKIMVGIFAPAIAGLLGDVIQF